MELRHVIWRLKGERHMPTLRGGGVPVCEQIERSITMSDRATMWFFAMFVPAILAMAPPLLVWASIAAGVCLLVAVGHMVASYRVGAKHE